MSNTEISQKLRGVGAALVTPMQANGQVDFEGLEKLLAHTSPHLDYFVVNGTTAESPTIGAKEQLEILEFVKQNNPNKLPIVFGMGGNNTQALVESFKTTNLDGVDAILSVSPYYNKPTQAGILKHYEAVADACSLPIIVYNVPPRTASNIEASTTIALSEHKNIIATKEAAGDLVQCMTIAKHSPEGFLLLSGDDLLTVPMISVGGSGVISVIANAFPKQFCAYVHAALAGKFEEAAKLWKPLLEINQLLFAEGNPAGVKMALDILGVCQPHVRLPLIAGSEKLRAKMEVIIEREGLK